MTLSGLALVLLTFAPFDLSRRDDVHLGLRGAFGLMVRMRDSQELTLTEVPSVNQRSSFWLCSASKTVTAKGSSRAVEAWANVAPCLAILASALEAFHRCARPGLCL